jgi:hypothetical protein
VNADRKAKDLEIEDFENEAGTLIELPGLRRADIAARERNAGDVAVQMFRGPVSVGLLGALVHDHFKPGDGDMTGGNPANLDQQYGLLSNRNARAAVDLSWDATDRVGFFSFYEYEHVIGIQRSNLTNAAPPVTQDAANDWSVKSTDRYDVAGLGFDVDVRSDLKVTLGYDLAHSRAAAALILELAHRAVIALREQQVNNAIHQCAFAFSASDRHVGNVLLQNRFETFAVETGEVLNRSACSTQERRVDQLRDVARAEEQD